MDSFAIVNIDNDEINARIKELDKHDFFSSQFNAREVFIWCIPWGYINVRQFIVYRDKGGKTQIHVNEYQNRGSKGKCSCLCSFRRAAESVDSLISQIRAILRDHGRNTDWIVIGNPAAAHIIKKYLDQSLTAITPNYISILFYSLWIKNIKVSWFIDYNLYYPNWSVYSG